MERGGGKGVYVLTDNAFRPFSRMSTVAGGNAVLKAQPVRIMETTRGGSGEGGGGGGGGADDCA